ncbi:hypothetical protein KUA19_41930 [Catellatospora sp. NEAU-YM18]|nr:hypothetical protein [Catellatospora tritici]
MDFHLLDRQIVDRAGLMVGNVDDIELDVGDDGVPYVVALLSGQEALGLRMGGRIGSLLARVARRLRQADEPPLRIPYDMVARVGTDVVLSVHRELLPEPGLERWLRENLIGHIPGARDEGQ